MLCVPFGTNLKATHRRCGLTVPFSGSEGNVPGSIWVRHTFPLLQEGGLDGVEMQHTFPPLQGVGQ